MRLVRNSIDRFIYSDGSLELPSGSLRPNYRYHHRIIRTVADLKATLRAGQYAWPGGYQMYMFGSDGSILSFDGARQDLEAVIEHIWNGGDLVCEINYDDPYLFCDVTGNRIPSCSLDDEEE